MSNFELCSPISTSDAALVVGAFHHIGVFGSSPLFQRDEAAGSDTTAFLHFDEESQAWLLSINGLETTVGMAAGQPVAPPATGWRILVASPVGFSSWRPMLDADGAEDHRSDVAFGEQATEAPADDELIVDAEGVAAVAAEEEEEEEPASAMEADEVVLQPAAPADRPPARLPGSRQPRQPAGPPPRLYGSISRAEGFAGWNAMPANPAASKARPVSAASAAASASDEGGRHSSEGGNDSSHYGKASGQHSGKGDQHFGKGGDDSDDEGDQHYGKGGQHSNKGGEDRSNYGTLAGQHSGKGAEPPGKGGQPTGADR